MTVSPEDAHQLTGKFMVTKSGTYTINFRTTGGQLNPNPVVYDIIAIADRPPQARFLRPDRPTVKVPANVKVDFVMTGSDDHGVKDATLHVNLENESILSKNVLEGRPAEPEFKATEVLDLAEKRRQARPEAALLADRPRQLHARPRTASRPPSRSSRSASRSRPKRRRRSRRTRPRTASSSRRPRRPSRSRPTRQFLPSRTAAARRPEPGSETSRKSRTIRTPRTAALREMRGNRRRTGTNDGKSGVLTREQRMPATVVSRTSRTPRATKAARQ